MNFIVKLLVPLFLIVINLCLGVEVDCSKLRIGQYICPDPSINHIDAKTQQPYGCTKDDLAKVWCIAADGLTCSETKNSSFKGEIPCRWT